MYIGRNSVRMDGCLMCTYGWTPYAYVLCVYALYMPGPDGTDVLEKIGASFGSFFFLCVYALYMTGPDGTDVLEKIGLIRMPYTYAV